MTYHGQYEVSNSRLNDNANWLQKTFIGSDINVLFDFEATFVINTNNIDIYYKDIDYYIDNGIYNEYDDLLHIDFDIEDIYIKSIETYDGVITTDKKLFGKKYDSQDGVSLVEIGVNDLRDKLIADGYMTQRAYDNLNEYFNEICNEIGIIDFILNQESFQSNNLILNAKSIDYSSVFGISSNYNYIENELIKNNHPNKDLDSLDYIVIHSTACKDVTALDFYDRCNSGSERGTSANFFIDNENVVRLLDVTQASYHTGVDNKSGIDNYNSIGIEICEFTDSDKQEKAINNAVEFVSYIKELFPNVKIVTHRDAKDNRTLCPNVLSDDEFNELFCK